MKKNSSNTPGVERHRFAQIYHDIATGWTARKECRQLRKHNARELSELESLKSQQSRLHSELGKVILSNKQQSEFPDLAKELDDILTGKAKANEAIHQLEQRIDQALKEIAEIEKKYAPDLLKSEEAVSAARQGLQQASKEVSSAQKDAKARSREVSKINRALQDLHGSDGQEAQSEALRAELAKAQQASESQEQAVADGKRMVEQATQALQQAEANSKANLDQKAECLQPQHAKKSDAETQIAETKDELDAFSRQQEQAVNKLGEVGMDHPWEGAEHTSLQQGHGEVAKQIETILHASEDRDKRMASLRPAVRKMKLWLTGISAAILAPITVLIIFAAVHFTQTDKPSKRRYHSSPTAQFISADTGQVVDLSTQHMAITDAPEEVQASEALAQELPGLTLSSEAVKVESDQAEPGRYLGGEALITLPLTEAQLATATPTNTGAVLLSTDEPYFIPGALDRSAGTVTIRMVHLSWFLPATEGPDAEINRIIMEEATKLASFTGKQMEEELTEMASNFLNDNFEELDGATKTKFLQSVVSRREDFAKLFSAAGGENHDAVVQDGAMLFAQCLADQLDDENQLLAGIKKVADGGRETAAQIGQGLGKMAGGQLHDGLKDVGSAIGKQTALYETISRVKKIGDGAQRLFKADLAKNAYKAYRDGRAAKTSWGVTRRAIEKGDFESLMSDGSGYEDILDYTQKQFKLKTRWEAHQIVKKQFDMRIKQEAEKARHAKKLTDLRNIYLKQKNSPHNTLISELRDRFAAMQPDGREPNEAELFRFYLKRVQGIERRLRHDGFRGQAWGKKALDERISKLLSAYAFGGPAAYQNALQEVRAELEAEWQAMRNTRTPTRGNRHGATPSESGNTAANTQTAQKPRSKNELTHQEKEMLERLQVKQAKLKEAIASSQRGINAIRDKQEKQIEWLESVIEADTKGLKEQLAEANDFIAKAQKYAAAATAPEGREEWTNRATNTKRMIADGTYVHIWYDAPRSGPKDIAHNQVGKRKKRIKDANQLIGKIRGALSDGTAVPGSGWTQPRWELRAKRDGNYSSDTSIKEFKDRITKMEEELRDFAEQESKLMGAPVEASKR